jgi:NitT/TauT family transport system substrate-binding protein
MTPIRKLCYIFCSIALLLMLIPRAVADDKLIIATAQHRAWESAATELGQQAGIFKKYGLALEFLFAQNGNEIKESVVSGKADVGLAVGVKQVMHAYAFGAPLRIISAHMAGSANYWYVLKASPIRSVKDFNGKIVAYETNGTSSHFDAIDLSRQFDFNAKLVPAGVASATFNQVKAGRIDVGWAVPPFGIDKILAGDIRVVARANDIPGIRGKTSNVMITHADTFQKRRDVLVRFLQAYQETIEWMYSDPTALQRYAELAEVPEGVARQLRDDVFSKNMLLPGKINGLNAITKDAIILRYLQKALSRQQTANLVQIAAPASGNSKPLLNWSFLDPLGEAVITTIETVISLSAITSLVSLSAAVVAIWVMLVATYQAEIDAPTAWLALTQRIALAALAISLMLNAVTPFITSDPPWLANLPLLAAIMGFLLTFGLLQTRAKRAPFSVLSRKDRRGLADPRMEIRRMRVFQRQLVRLWRA